MAQSFTGVDVELWAAVFLQDIESMFSAQMLEKTFQNGCGALAERLLTEKELLAVKISGRLSHVLQPLNGENGEDIRQAREAFADKLRSSLLYACGKNILLQYPGKTDIQIGADAECHLAGNITVDGFAEPVQLKAGKINLTDKESRLHIFAEADRLRNASFLLNGAQYQIRELEWIPGQEGEDCPQSRWFSFLRPLGKTKTAENIEIDLSCGLAVPSPLRFYPSQPVLKSHNITAKEPEEIGDISELLCYDYHVVISHEMKGQDMIYLTVVFNENPKSGRRNGTKDVFDCLAQYNSVRNSLLSFLQGEGDGFEKAYETMISLVQETEKQWEYFAEPRFLKELEEKTYDCRFRLQTKENELCLELYTEEQTLPVISYISPEDGGQKFTSEKTEEGGRYRLAGIDTEQLSDQITLRLTFEKLDIMTYQSVYARSHATRNEDLSDAFHPVNESFLYATEETAFAAPLNALVNRRSDLPVFIPAEYLKEDEFEERAVRYLFEEMLGMGRYGAQLACDISYGYRIGESSGTCVELPICLQPRTTYTDAWRTGLTEYIREWEKQHSPPVYGRYLRIGITVFSTELQAEGAPVVKLEEIRLTESR